MSCEKYHELMPEVALGAAEPTSEMKSHLAACSECDKTLKAMRETMALLDEWQAPEPSPYFDTRLQARLREEQQKPVGLFATGLSWFRKPAFGVAAVAVLAFGAAFVSGDRFPPVPGGSRSAQVVPVKGTPVADLQFLDKHSDLLQDFDSLDSDDDDVPQSN